MKLRRRMENDIERDLRDHIELETQDNVERGMSPGDARAAALRKFGNVLQTAENTRAVWRWMWAERLLQDIRYAFRGLRRSPVFTVVAILTLALGIGMNTAVFSIVSAVLIKPLPYPNIERLVWIADFNHRYNFESSSTPDFSDWRRRSQSFEAMAGYTAGIRTVQNGDDSDTHWFVSITPEFWRMVGAHAALGRLFSEGDRDGVVLTWPMFEQRFAGNPAVLGQVISVDGEQQTVIGVLSKDFRFQLPTGFGGSLSGDAEAFTVKVITPDMESRVKPPPFVMYVVGRLKPGVSIEKARADLQTIQTSFAQENPSMRAIYADIELHVVPLREKLVGASRQALLILMAAVAFVLLIACANLVNLLLARATARQRELAIRTTIGAGRARLLRQFLVEGLALALLGGAAGIALAHEADALIIRLSPAAVPRLADLGIDWRVSLFGLAISLLMGAIFGLAPVLSLSEGSLYSLLREGGRGASAGPSGLRMQRGLVAAELALALILLTGAGLMVKSFSRMYAHPASFEPEKIGLMVIGLSGPAYRDPAAQVGYAQRLIEQTSQVPGVQASALMITSIPLVVPDGPSRLPQGQGVLTNWRVVSADYPKVLGIPLRKGRWIIDDEPTPVAVVNETFARRVYGNDDPLGQPLSLGNMVATIVGVEGDVKTSRLDAEPAPEVLTPYKQRPSASWFVLFKTTGSAAAMLPQVRKVVQRIDPTLHPFNVMTMEESQAASIAPRRFNFLLLGTFAVSAVLLALIGVYGVMSYAVTQRTQEIGIRMALGAQRNEIVRMVVRQGMIVACAGIVIGIAGAFALTRLMTTLLYDVKPNDPFIFVTVTLSLTVAALAACWMPAAKAARVDPLLAIRYE